MSLVTIIFAFLVLALFGVFPVWKHSRSWGFAPFNIVGLAFIFYALLIFVGVI